MRKGGRNCCRYHGRPRLVAAQDLKAQCLKALLAAYLLGSPDEQDCEEWASALKCLDDVHFEASFEELLRAGLAALVRFVYTSVDRTN